MNFLSRFEEFHNMASEAAGGLSNFGPDDYHDAMQKLLSDYDRFPVYTPLGVETLEQQIVGLLVGRLILFQGLKDHPETSAAQIEKPIFIVGMARTGTTVLHRILTHDDSIQSLPFWLANAPMPRPPRETWESHPVFQQVRQALENSMMTNEELRAAHPIAPEIADECRWVTDQTFWASSIVLATETPDYRWWYLHADSRYAYDYHRKALSLVALNDNRRWVLKDPGHIWGIDSLLATYPDACIVQTHRDPFDCMRSISNMALMVRKHTEEGATAEAIGEAQLEFWSHGLRKTESFRRQQNSDRFIDFHIQETRDDPVRVIEQIFDHFDLPVTEEARASWHAQIAVDPHMGYKGKGVQQDFGLTREGVQEAVGDYYERYLGVCEQAGVRAN